MPSRGLREALTAVMLSSLSSSNIGPGQARMQTGCEHLSEALGWMQHVKTQSQTLRVRRLAEQRRHLCSFGA